MMERHAISRETIRAFLSPGEGGGYGLGPDALSGYTAYAADMLHPLDISDENGTEPPAAPCPKLRSEGLLKTTQGYASKAKAAGSAASG